MKSRADPMFSSTIESVMLPLITSSFLILCLSAYILFPTWKRALIWFFRKGPIPRHIAFIMDGNRRYARGRNVEVSQGHLSGFSALEKTLDWSLDLGVTCVTIYAFSIENFKRTEKEVDALMRLAKAKMIEMQRERSLIEKYGLRVQVIGDLDLVPVDVKEAAISLMEATKENDRCILNVAFSYTSRSEILQAAKKSGSSITVASIESNLYTADSPPLDILIRTSGEVRLSDFMMWQVSSTNAKHQPQIHFLGVLWPDFSFWDMIPALIEYQYSVLFRK